MKTTKITYLAFLIFWSLYLGYLGKTEIEICLNVIVILLLLIFLTLTDKKNKP